MYAVYTKHTQRSVCLRCKWHVYVGASSLWIVCSVRAMRAVLCCAVSLFVCLCLSLGPLISLFFRFCVLSLLFVLLCAVVCSTTQVTVLFVVDKSSNVPIGQVAMRQSGLHNSYLRRLHVCTDTLAWDSSSRHTIRTALKLVLTRCASA